MTVKLEYEKLTRAATRAEELATAIRTNAASARAASPIPLPSLEGIEAKATVLETRAEVLNGLADLAVLLDTSGEGTVSMPMSDLVDTVKDLLGDYLGAEVWNFFGNEDDFPLVSLGLAIGKMTRMSRGVAPIFQTGIVGKFALQRMFERGGRVGQWAEWLMKGPKHRMLPTSLLKQPAWVTRAGSLMPSAGWGDPLRGLKGGGLGMMRGLGIVGGVASTASGAYNLYQQGNPVEAFKREGAGYVADVAETAFSASTTAFLVAPNPVTGALAVGSGLVWAGAEVVDHWDDISETASKAWEGAGDLAEGAGDLASKAADKLTFWD